MKRQLIATTLCLVGGAWIAACGTEGQPDPDTHLAYTPPDAGDDSGAPDTGAPDAAGACDPVGKWRLDYGAFLGAQPCSAAASNDTLDVVHLGDSNSRQYRVRWAEGCRAELYIGPAVGAHAACQALIICDVDENNTTELWTTHRELSVSFAGGSGSGQISFTESGFCSGRGTASVTATRLTP